MQSKGAIRFVTICLLLACLWQLSFTAVTALHNKKAEQRADQIALAADVNAIAEADRAFYLDSIRKIESRRYTDSISGEKVYLGYTFKQVQNQEINLGLDLKGGMNVMLQVQLEDLVRALAGNNQSPEFLKAISLAKERSVNSQSDFITLFAEAMKETAPGTRLAQIFGTYEMRDRIKPESTDEQVVSVIKEEAESAVANSFNVLRNRIDRFGVTQPSIQKLGNTGRILVELPGVKEPERVRKLLQGTASLEFWPTFTYDEMASYLDEANLRLAEILSADAPAAVEEAASEAMDAVAQELQAQNAADDATVAAARKANPLYAVLSPSGMRGNACIGFAAAADTAQINKYLHMPEIEAVFPAEFRPMWSVQPSSYMQSDNIYELIAIKGVSMTMNAEGANVWARLTKENIGRQVAIVLDGTVYSYPTVQTEITGGSSSITGNFTIDEATDLTNVLKSGKLPAPATIVQEQVVGPSLGAESIRAGLLSFLIAFCAVLIYMLIFYKGAGVAADIALLSNVVLLFGTLSAFGAVLTLPGIAGLVLTLGMAVDANVIIYERVKEELKAGKGLGKAVADGYKNAYSAIIDGQVTTLLTGLVLFFFGSGPIKGFATTLIIGIITSVLTSIFITRLIFDDRIVKGKNITFENKWSANFLKNTHINFLGGRKWSYIISGALIVIALGSMFTKGFTYGVDFTGGRTYVVRFDKPVTAEDVGRCRDRRHAVRVPEGLLRGACDLRELHLHAGEPQRYHLLRQGGRLHRQRHQAQRHHLHHPRPHRHLRLHRDAVQGLELGSRRCRLPGSHRDHHHRLLLPVQRHPAVQPGRGPDLHRGHPDDHRLRHQRQRGDLRPYP